MITKIIYGNMKWWCPEESPSSFDELPSQFVEAHDLWQADKEKNFNKIADLLGGFLRGAFVAENIPSFDDFFEFDNVPEVDSYDLKLVGVSFQNSSPIPSVKTEAFFKVPFKDEVDFNNLNDNFEERGCSLSDCISFRWNFEEREGLMDFDTTFGDHSGSEAQIS
jgi:hypothetical protein